MTVDAQAIAAATPAIHAWMKAKEEAAKATALEFKLRGELAALLFPGSPEGMNNLDLGNGWTFKGDFKMNYTLNNKQKEGFLTSAALTAIAKLGPESAVKAQRLVRWQPDLSLTEYKLLNDAERALLIGGATPALTIKPAAPALTIVPPKEAKA